MKNLLIRPNANIKDALQQLSITGEKCLVVVDKKNSKVGDFLHVIIEDCTSATLIGKVK